MTLASLLKGKLMLRPILLVAALFGATAFYDPDPGPSPEGCGFLPVAERYLLPPDHPCYLEPPPPPPPPCYDPLTQQQVVCQD